jgi:hypothetical protein
VQWHFENRVKMGGKTVLSAMFNARRRNFVTMICADENY